MLISLQNRILQALTEDNFEDDVTGSALFSNTNQEVTAQVIAKEPGIFSGVRLVQAFQALFEEDVKFELLVKEGQAFGLEPLVRLKGDVQDILRIERTLLNFLSRTCAVATTTKKYADKLSHTRTVLLATRKTTPLLKELELQAVVAGGGHIHRRTLSDGILIKENHLMCIGISQALKNARTAASPLHKVEIEVQSLSQLDEVLKSEFLPHIIMLDNFSPQDLQIAKNKIPKDCQIEVSGGVNLETISKIAELGVDFISVGRLTHSAGIVNLSLDIL